MKLDNLKPGTLDHPKKYGLLETKENTWMGNSDGPLTYDDQVVAQIAAQVLCERLKWPMGRIQVELFSSANAKIEDLIPPISAEQALEILLGEENP